MTVGPTLLAGAAAITAGPGTWQPGPEELMYFQDLHRPFGAHVDETRIRSGARVSHSDLVRLLLSQAPETAAAAQHADLVVVASGLPDLHPFTPASVYLSHRLDSPGRRFTVSEQGSAAPFTAMRIASAYCRSGRARTAAVLIVEQSTHPVRDAAVDSAGASDSGALLVLGEGKGPRISEVLGVRGESPAQMKRLLEQRLSDLASATRPAGKRAGPALLILGPHVPADLRVPDGTVVHRVDRPAYSTGPWLDLAENHTGWTAAYRRVVLCEADARRPERSCLLALDGDGSGDAA